MNHYGDNRMYYPYFFTLFCQNKAAFHEIKTPLQENETAFGQSKTIIGENMLKKHQNNR
jgi:hypothetical protein